MQAKILIVEDEAITAMDIKTTLEIFGYNVVSTAFSAEEAIGKTKKLKPDLVLMDINLKGDMDGIEAASQIMTIFNIPVIYLTAHSDENTFQRAKLTEPYGFIPKPVDYNGLKATIENALYKHSIELKLKESEARYRSIYENSFDAILLTRPDCSILAANPAAEKMFQMNEDEIIKVGQNGIMVDDDNLKRAINECEQKGIINTELTAKRKDGSIFPIELTGSVFKDTDGSFKTSVIIRDITKRKKAEDHFRKEVERESFLLELYKKSPELSDEELYKCALDYTINLTDSSIGFLHLISDDQKNIILDTWNNEALKTCTSSFKAHYPIEEAGNWTDCIKTKGPVVYNDFKNSPNQKGQPEGHIHVKRFISIPVFNEDKIRFIFGVGNKVEEYDDHDVLQIQSVANELYKIIKHRHGK